MDTRIYCITHKKFKKPDVDIYMPLHVGKVIADDLGYLGDDTGNNISAKNKTYCELTGMYWIWKNIDCDIVGICHYRRYFFKDKRPLSKEYIEHILCDEKYDLIVSQSGDTKYSSIREHYACVHYAKDYDVCEKILKQMYPEYSDAFDIASSHNFMTLGNMIIARKGLYDEYCNWLFPLLFEVEKTVDISDYDEFQARIFGYLAERLFRVWILGNKLKVREEEVVLIDTHNDNKANNLNSIQNENSTDNKLDKNERNNMNKVLIYRYNSICEPAVISAFKSIGLGVDEITNEITDKTITAEKCLKLVSDKLSKEQYAFVFTINFYPAISEVCQIYKIPYISWTVDCPIMELYSDSIKNSCNRIFLFDHAQYEEFYNENPECIFYMPLAADVLEYDKKIQAPNISVDKYVSDVSFVGSLYSEKCTYNEAVDMPPYFKGYLDGIMKAQAAVYGFNLLTETLTIEDAKEYAKYGKMYKFPEKSTKNEVASLAHNVLSYKIAEIERKQLLNKISEKYNIDLYTHSDTRDLPKVHNCGGANTYTEMPLIFNRSKINLNFTIKAIQTGLPLRIWDIMGCGGFVLTNYQQEIPEYFEIGKDIEVFTNENELLEKIEYYLTHEAERAAIALNGYNKVKEYHTWINRVVDILKIVFG